MREFDCVYFINLNWGLGSGNKHNCIEGGTVVIFSQYSAKHGFSKNKFFWQ